MKNRNVGQALPDNALKGFTLIELLVVVLILGILSAIAISQYNRAAYKARAMEGMSIVKTIANAQELYYISHGDYTNDIKELDVTISPDLIGTWNSALFNNKYSYACTEKRTCGAWAQSPNLPAFEICLIHKDSYGQSGKFLCQIYEANGLKYNDLAKEICQKLGTEDTEVGNKYAHAKGKYFVIAKNK